MPDRLSTTHAEPRARRRAAAPARASEAETLAAVDRAAAVPHGLSILEQAPLEAAAVLLGVEPTTIERVRVALDDRSLRAEAERRFARTAEARRAAAAPSAATRAAPPRDADELLRAARARDGGLALLLDAAPEAAAVVFGVHPALVERAREAATRDRPGSA